MRDPVTGELPLRGAKEPRASADAWLAAACTVLFALPYALMGSVYNMQIFVLTLGVTLPLALRRRNPLLMVSLVVIAGTALLIVSDTPPSAVMVVPIVTYSVGRFVDDERARWVVYLGLVFSVAAPVRWVLIQSAAQLSATVVVGLICAGAVVTPYVIGRRMYEAAAAEQNEWRAAQERYQLLVEQRNQALRMAEVRTRTAIAQELHDIVAHSLSVMIVQAEGGKALAAKRPEQAEEVLGTIAETGREALTEMRRIVGVLRTGETPSADYAPAPGLGDIADMVHRAGDRVQFEASGPMPTVSQTIGLIAYRIVQESVTNFLKHAGPNAHARVRLRAVDSWLEIEVVDNGLGAAAPSDGEGSGLPGMRERVGTVGGYLVAQPQQGGGFAVRARLPITPPMQRMPR